MVGWRVSTRIFVVKGLSYSIWPSFFCFDAGAVFTWRLQFLRRNFRNLNFVSFHVRFSTTLSAFQRNCSAVLGRRCTHLQSDGWRLQASRPISRSQTLAGKAAEERGWQEQPG